MFLSLYPCLAQRLVIWICISLMSNCMHNYLRCLDPWQSCWWNVRMSKSPLWWRTFRECFNVRPPFVIEFINWPTWMPLFGRQMHQIQTMMCLSWADAHLSMSWAPLVSHRSLKPYPAMCPSSDQESTRDWRRIGSTLCSFLCMVSCWTSQAQKQPLFFSVHNAMSLCFP